MKKHLILLLVLTLIISLLIGCGNGNVQSGTSQESTSKDNGEPIKVIIAHAGTEQTAMHLAWLKAKEVLERDNVFKVELHPNGTLGNDQQLQEAVQNGDITMTACSSSSLATFEPRISVFSTPFLFPNKEIAYKVLDGSFGQKMLDMMQEQGFKALGYFESSSYRAFSSNKPVYTPEDLKGMKVRVIQNSLHIKLWESLGASPTGIPFSELYTSLQQGTVEAQDNPLELIISQRFFEVQDYITITNHMFQVGMATCNLDWYNSLNEQQQKIVNDAIKAGVEFQRDLAEKEYDSYIKTLKDAGLEIITLSDDVRKLFEDKMTPVYDEVGKEVGQELLDEVLKAVKDSK